MRTQIETITERYPAADLIEFTVCLDNAKDIDDLVMALKSESLPKQAYISFYLAADYGPFKPTYTTLYHDPANPDEDNPHLFDQDNLNNARWMVRGRIYQPGFDLANKAIDCKLAATTDTKDKATLQDIKERMFIEQNRFIKLKKVKPEEFGNLTYAYQLSEEQLAQERGKNLTAKAEIYKEAVKDSNLEHLITELKQQADELKQYDDAISTKTANDLHAGVWWALEQFKNAKISHQQFNNQMRDALKEALPLLRHQQKMPLFRIIALSITIVGLLVAVPMLIQWLFSLKLDSIKQKAFTIHGKIEKAVDLIEEKFQQTGAKEENQLFKQQEKPPLNNKPLKDDSI